MLLGLIKTVTIRNFVNQYLTVKDAAMSITHRYGAFVHFDNTTSDDDLGVVIYIDEFHTTSAELVQLLSCMFDMAKRQMGKVIFRFNLVEFTITNDTNLVELKTKMDKVH